MRKIFFIIIISLLSSFVWGATSVTNSKSYVYPFALETYYFTCNVSYYYIDVSITNGFIDTNLATTRIYYGSTKCVSAIWNNPSNLNGNTPSGKLSFRVYNKNNELLESYDYQQRILSLKDLNMIQVKPDIDLNLEYGKKKINISSETEMYYPNFKDNTNMPIPVHKFEWTLPVKWKAIGNVKEKNGLFYTTSPSITVETDMLYGGTVTVRAVDPLEGGDFSKTLELVFKRSFDLLSYPKTIFFENNSYAFKVTHIQDWKYEWEAPAGWIINGGNNTLSQINASNVNIQSSTCILSENPQIKVRVYDNKTNDVSDWIIFPIQFELPRIEKPLKKLKQFEKFNFNINGISTHLIDSIKWFRNGVVVYDNGNSSDFSINHSGVCNLSAKIKNINCGEWIDLKPISLDIETNPDVFISGSDLICPNTNSEFSYEIKGVPNHTNRLIWVCSNDKLSLANNNGTFFGSELSKWRINDINYNGSSSITCYLLIQNDTIPIIKNIWIGVPNWADIKIIEVGSPNGYLNLVDINNKGKVQHIGQTHINRFEWFVPDWNVVEDRFSPIPMESVLIKKTRASQKNTIAQVRAYNDCGCSGLTPPYNLIVYLDNAAEFSLKTDLQLFFDNSSQYLKVNLVNSTNVENFKISVYSKDGDLIIQDSFVENINIDMSKFKSTIFLFTIKNNEGQIIKNGTFFKY